MPNISFSAYPGVPALTLNPRTGCVVTGGNTVTKTSGGAAAWDSDCYSSESYVNGAMLSFSPAQTTATLMVGLNEDPTTNQTYTGIDFGLYIKNTGAVNVYESGVNRGQFGTYVAGNVLSVVYNGATISYRNNGVEFYSTPVAAGLTFYLDSSFYHLNGAINNVTFAGLSMSFCKGRIYPLEDPVLVNVPADYSEAGQLYAYDKGIVEQFFYLNFAGLTATDYANFANWLTTIAVGPKNTFTYTAEDGIAHTVRLMDSKNPLKQTSFGLYGGTITLREEIA